jgi:hypothetical protein
MSRLVQWGDKIMPRSLFEADLSHQADSCTVCGGATVMVEQIDDERLDVVVPCWGCRMYCRDCRKYVKKNGHQCAVAVPAPEKERKP